VPDQQGTHPLPKNAPRPVPNCDQDLIGCAGGEPPGVWGRTAGNMHVKPN